MAIIDKGSKYEKMTKEDLVKECICLNRNIDELNENIDEMRTNLQAINDNANHNAEIIAKLHEERESLWKVINKAIDFKDMLDDVEDTAEELKEMIALLPKRK